MSEQPRRAAYREQGPPNGPSNAELREAKRIELEAQLAALNREQEHADAWGEADTPYYGTGERTDLQGYYDWQNARTPLDGEADLFNNFDANGNLKPEAARPEYADLSLTQLAKEGRRLKEMNDKAGIDEVWNALQDKLVEKATAQDWTEKQMFDQLDRYEAMLFAPKSEVAVPTPTTSPTEVTPPAPAPDETGPTGVDPHSLEGRLLTPENQTRYNARVENYRKNSSDKRSQLRANAQDAVNAIIDNPKAPLWVWNEAVISREALKTFDEIEAEEASNGGGSKDATVEPEPVVVTDPEVIVIDPDKTEPVVTGPDETDPPVDPEPTPDPTPTEPAPAPASSEVTPPEPTSEEPAKPEVQKGSEGFAFSSEDLTPGDAESEVMKYIGQADPAGRIVAYGVACSEFVKYGMARHWNVGEMTLARNRMDGYYNELAKDNPAPQDSEAASATPATPTSEEVTPAVVPKRRLAPSRVQQAEQAASGAARSPESYERLDSLVDQLIEDVQQTPLEDRLEAVKRAKDRLFDAWSVEGWDKTRYLEGVQRLRDATADMPMVLPVVPPAGGEAAPAGETDPVVAAGTGEVIAAAAAIPTEGAAEEEQAPVYGERDPVRIFGRRLGRWVAGTTLGYYGWKAKNYLGKTLRGSRTASPKTDARGRELR